MCVSWSDQPSLQLLWVFFVQNIFCVWELKGRLFENLNFGKTGFKTYVLEKHFISYSCILFIIFNALRSFFKNQVIYSKMLFFQNFNWSKLFIRSIETAFKIFCEPLSVSINRNWFLINQNSWIRFLKNQIWLVQTSFFKTFQNFFLSLWLGKAPQRFFLSFSSKFLARFLSP